MICFVKNVAGQNSDKLSKAFSQCVIKIHFKMLIYLMEKHWRKVLTRSDSSLQQDWDWGYISGSLTRAGAWELQPSHSWGGWVTLVPLPRLSLPLTCRAHLLTHILLFREWSSHWICLHTLCDPPHFFPVHSGVKPSTPVKSTWRFSAFQTFM